jgi:hypothetical protein
MRYDAFDIIDIKVKNMVDDEIKSQIHFRDQMVEKWNNIAKLQPTLLQFLKDNIHKNA